MLQLAFVVVGVWTLLAFAVALVLGPALRRLQPVAVRVETRRHLRVVKNSQF
jgi:hypothetical protein